MLAGHSVLFFLMATPYAAFSTSDGVNLNNFAIFNIFLWAIQMLIDWCVYHFAKETRRPLIRAFYMCLEGWVTLYSTLAISLLFYFFAPKKNIGFEISAFILVAGLLFMIAAELIRVKNKIRETDFDNEFKEEKNEIVLSWKKHGFISTHNASAIARWNDKILIRILMVLAPLGMGGVMIATRLLQNSSGNMAICFLLAILMTPVTYIFWSRAAINLYVNFYKPLQVELRTGKPVVYDKYPDVFRGLVGTDEF